jgi:Zn-dependent protease
MGLVRHPFDAAPYDGPRLRLAGTHDGAVLHPSVLALSRHDEALIRRLRPERVMAWALPLGSALVSLIPYWALWGPVVAGGLVAGMWAHELGHRILARRLGLGPSPIAFVPFVGAMQRLRSQPASALDGALLGLAGPLSGMWFALACQLVATAGAGQQLRFVGTAHAVLALIDLLPLAMLDGARVVGSLSRPQRVVGALAAVGVCVASLSWWLVPSCAALSWVATRPSPAHGSWAVTWILVVLLAAAAGLLP